MTDTSSMPLASQSQNYSRHELMSQLGLAPDEIDTLLGHPKGSVGMRATLSAILDHLRSIYDSEQERIGSFLKRHYNAFDGSPLATMLCDEDGANRVQRYLASDVYSTW